MRRLSALFDSKTPGIKTSRGSFGPNAYHAPPADPSANPHANMRRTRPSREVGAPGPPGPTTPCVDGGGLSTSTPGSGRPSLRQRRALRLPPDPGPDPDPDSDPTHRTSRPRTDPPLHTERRNPNMESDSPKRFPENHEPIPHRRRHGVGAMNESTAHECRNHADGDAAARHRTCTPKIGSH